MQITIGQVDISEQRIKDLLCCALEGGSNYWYWIERFNYPPGQDQQSLGLEFRHLDLPFVEGGSLTIVDKEELEPIEGEHTLDRDAMARGLKQMAVDYPKHWSDFMTENEDADTGDVFLQLSLFGEVVFG